MKNYDVAIIGGGASGLVAAIMAARAGKHVILIEKNDKFGKKILLTGNGRCNISNENVEEDCKKPTHYFGTQPKFVMSVLNQFGLDDTKEFFGKLGIEMVEEDAGRLFPASNQAQSVVDVLMYEVRELGIKVAKPNKPKEIRFNPKNKIFEFVLSDGQEIAAKSLVVATGGKSHGYIGSTGDGYEIAGQFGHTIIETFPAYSALNAKSALCQKLQGVKLEVAVKAYTDDEKFAENTGTIMFAHFGLSAPVVLEISRQIAYEQLINNKAVTLKLNFLPQIDPQTMDRFLIERFEKNPNKTLAFSFVGLLPKKVFPALLEVEGIDPEMKVAEVSKDLRKKIIKLLTEYKFEIDSVRGFEEAHFTAGGIDTKEVNPQTLESKLQSGLFFCGEVLDIDGECGGYNLQWAWSSGAVAGQSA